MPSMSRQKNSSPMQTEVRYCVEPHGQARGTTTLRFRQPAELRVVTLSSRTHPRVSSWLSAKEGKERIVRFLSLRELKLATVESHISEL